MCFYLELLDDEEEVLSTLTESIPALVDYVGGGLLLLPALEKLCYAEDVKVRDQVSYTLAAYKFDQLFLKAILGLKKCIAKLDYKKNEEGIIGIIKRFVSADFHTAKGSASSLIPFVYPCKKILEFAILV